MSGLTRLKRQFCGNDKMVFSRLCGSYGASRQFESIVPSCGYDGARLHFDCWNLIVLVRFQWGQGEKLAMFINSLNPTVY